MKLTTAATAIGALSVANALPKGEIVERQSGINDGVILNYALTLEHLEDTFYRTGLQKFSAADFAQAGFPTTFYKNVQEVSFDEKTHVSFLTGALQAAGVTPVKECTYNFGNAFSSPATFIATAAVLEGVGVAAYLGAAASIANKAYLTAAGSILTVESRHSAYLRGVGVGSSPFPQPFDDPLDFNEVYTLAAPFIASCPSDSPALPLKAFPSLTLSPNQPMPVKTGSKITLVVGKKLNKSDKVYACFITVTGPLCSDARISYDGKSVSTVVPAGVYGQSYVVVNNCNNKVTDDTVIAGPAIVEVAGTAGGY